MQTHSHVRSPRFITSTLPEPPPCAAPKQFSLLELARAPPSRFSHDFLIATPSDILLLLDPQCPPKVVPLRERKEERIPARFAEIVIARTKFGACGQVLQLRLKAIRPTVFGSGLWH